MGIGLMLIIFFAKWFKHWSVLQKSFLWAQSNTFESFYSNTQRSNWHRQGIRNGWFSRQGRVKDLEEYCEIIKAELEALKNKEKQRKVVNIV